VNFKQDRSIYLQIADYITENILSQKWKANDRIPSVRDLAVSVEVNPNTVAHTYNYLQEKGIIYNQRGIGYFIAENGLKKTQELKKESFIKEELYHLFKSIDLLGMTFDDLKQIYDDYKLGNNQFIRRQNENQQ
jgi:DNA-binding transcriptional regulator YhcF (GntR family)